MPRTLSLALTVGTLLIVAACTGGTAVSQAPATTAPTTAPSAESPAPSAESPAASESAASTEACAPSTESGTVAVTIANFSFDPETISATVGDVVTWTNSDGAPHTATVSSDGTCTTATLASGASGGIVFEAAGTYDYFCKIHPQMMGKVEVS